MRSVGAQGEAQCGEGGEPGVGLLGVQRRRSRDGAEQGAGPGGRVEDAADRTVGGRAAGVLRGFGEVRHQLGEVRRGQRELAGVGVQVPAEQELEGLTRPDPGGELRGGAQKRHGGQQGLRGGGANGSRPVNSRSHGRVRRVNHRGPGCGGSRRGRAGRNRFERGRAGRGRAGGSRRAGGPWGCGPAGAGVPEGVARPGPGVPEGLSGPSRAVSTWSTACGSASAIRSSDAAVNSSQAVGRSRTSSRAQPVWTRACAAPAGWPATSCQTRSRSGTSASFPWSRSHCSTSASAKDGLAAVPPTGWGKSA